MSFKRQSKFDSGNESKKQRLDVSISSENFPSSQNVALPNPNTAMDNELWGDEDDAIFLVASQAYEQSEACDMSNIANYTTCMRPPLTSTQKAVIEFEQGPSDDNRGQMMQPSYTSNKPLKSREEQNMYSSIKNIDNEKPSTSEFIDANFFNDDFGASNENYKEKNTSMEKFKKPIPPNIQNISGNNINNEHLVMSRHFASDKQMVSNVSTAVSNDQMQNMLRQLRTMKLENEKLKNQHDLLTDKCLTKDGEATILRSQLKSMQLQMDALKLDKLKSHEKNQLEWNTNLQAVTKELQSYKSQIEFKNLEINTANERCRMLENSKIKFVEPTQPTLENSSRRFGPSQKFNLSMRQQPASKSSHVSTKESTCQTSILKTIALHPPRTLYYPVMKQIHESIYHQQPSGDVPMSFSSIKNSTLVEHSSYSYIRKRILNDLNKSHSKTNDYNTNVKMENIYGDLSKISQLTQEEIVHGNLGISNALKITLVAKELLIKTLRQLQNWSLKVTTQSLREMDMKYLEMSGKESITASDKNVFDRSCWCKDEQAIETRRITAVFSIICKNYLLIAEFVMGLKLMKELGTTIDKSFLAMMPLCNDYCSEDKQSSKFLEIILDICKNIGYIGCSHLFTGLLTSILLVLKRCIKRTINRIKCLQSIFDILKQVVLLRPDKSVILEVSKVLKQLSRSRDFLEILCDDKEMENVISDMSQGVVLFNNKSCFLQVLCSQVEVSAFQLCTVKEMKFVFELTDGILNLCYCGTYLNIPWASCKPDYGCQCSSRIYQCLAVCLYICSCLYKEHILYLNDANFTKRINSTIRAGIMMLNFCVLKDIDFITRLGNHEGNFQLFIENCNSMSDHLQLTSIHEEALADLQTSIIIPIFEEQKCSPPEAQNLWDSSFNKFMSIV